MSRDSNVKPVSERFIYFFERFAAACEPFLIFIAVPGTIITVVTIITAACVYCNGGAE